MTGGCPLGDGIYVSNAHFQMDDRDAEAVQVVTEGRGVQGGGKKETSRMDTHGSVRPCGPDHPNTAPRKVQRPSSDRVPTAHRALVVRPQRCGWRAERDGHGKDVCKEGACAWWRI